MAKKSRELVAKGYDQIADAYFDRFGVSATRQKWLDRLIDILFPQTGHILDPGCGGGIPVARTLATLGHSVVSVDLSAQQIVRARQNLPEATFMQADMCDLSFPPESFDAVCAFYSITHIPPEEQASLPAKIATWLRPQGLFIGSFGTGAAGDWEGSWLGTTMYFGSVSEEATLNQLRPFV